MGGQKIAWVSDFRYLGYYILSKLGWSKMISVYKVKIRQRLAIIRTCKLHGTSSKEMRRILFISYVLPLFSWLFSIFPLMSNLQRDELGHFYLTCLKKCLGYSCWNDVIFMTLSNEVSLENRGVKYWKKFLSHLLKSTDGQILFEQQIWNRLRTSWIDYEYKVKGIHRSKRIVPYTTTVEKCLSWTQKNDINSIPNIEEDIQLLRTHPDSFG